MENRKIRIPSAEFSALYRFGDLFTLCLSLVVISFFYTDGHTENLFFLFVLTSVIYLIFAESSSLYRSWRTDQFRSQISTTLKPWVGACGSLCLYIIVSNRPDSLLNLALIWFLTGAFGLFLWRFITRQLTIKLRNYGYNLRHAAIVGVTPYSLELAKELQKNTQLGIQLHGFFEDRNKIRVKKELIDSDVLDTEASLDDNLPSPILGNVEYALKLVKEGKIQYVYLAFPMNAKERIKHYLTLFSDTTATVYIVPDFFIYNLLCSRWQNVGNIPTLSIYDTPFSGSITWLKRFEDIVLSSAILTLISPVLLAVAAGVKLSSPGPVIFKQDRYGLDGRRIQIWKFRSMSVMDNGDDVKQATKNDPRVTKFGAFIRRTSLDELPQFFNVLQGTMSVVGPRPHAVAHNEQYRQIVDRYMLRHKVKPGITGWAQINGYRGETDTIDKMEKRVQFDLEYIQNWTFSMDIKIVFKTIFKGFTGKSAY